MIDELDLLKRNWQNIDKTFTQVSENQIYKMIHKRSSNIVKWILIISLFELALLIFSALFFKFSKNKDLILTSHEMFYFNIFEFISFVILVIFVFKFYKNYKKISFDSTSKNLLNSIVNTRKTVEMYVKITIGYSITSAYILLGMIMINHNEMQLLYDKFSEKGGAFLFYIIFVFSVLISIVIVFGFLWLFYKLLYGILLKKLLKNYNEIQQLEL